MKPKFTFKTIGIVTAMTLSTLTIAQGNPSSTLDVPSQTGTSYDSSEVPFYLAPVDDSPWGHHPGAQNQVNRQPRGAQGPIRSKSGQEQGSRWERFKALMAQPVGNRAYVGFLDWRENNTDTP